MAVLGWIFLGLVVTCVVAAGLYMYALSRMFRY